MKVHTPKSLLWILCNRKQNPPPCKEKLCRHDFSNSNRVLWEFLSPFTARPLSIDTPFYLKPVAYCTAERQCIHILELEKFWSNVFLIQKNSAKAPWINKSLPMYFNRLYQCQIFFNYLKKCPGLHYFDSQRPTGVMRWFFNIFPLL